MNIENTLEIRVNVKATIRDAKTGRIKRVQYRHNIIPTAGRAAIANQLTQSSPSPDPLRINYVGVGTGVTAPANGDTALETETFRNLVASQTNADNIAYITMFIGAAEDTGTYREAGLFIDGTASVDTGTLFSHVAINITKGGTETLTLDWTVTIS